MTQTEQSRFLLAHEWIASIGGSENVFRELMRIVPGDAFCLWNDVPETFGAAISESWLARSPLRGRKIAALPLMPSVWRHIDFDAYDSVMVSSHAFAHHLAAAAARSGRRSFAYVHTPARYVWAPEAEHRGRGWVARVGRGPLRRIDRNAIDGRVNYAANSEFIRRRIQRSWDVDATVIYPPVQVDKIIEGGRWTDALSVDDAKIFDDLPRDGFILGASRLVSYKRIDSVIDVGSSLGMPVVIAGSGPDEAALRSQAAHAGVPVHFLGHVSDEQLYALYQEASLYVFLPVEDFGIMPVEAMACGTPVLVNEYGGAAESVGKLCGGQTIMTELPMAEIAAAASRAIDLDMSDVKQRAKMFSYARFGDNIRRWTSSTTSESR